MAAKYVADCNGCPGFPPCWLTTWIANNINVIDRLLGEWHKKCSFLRTKTKKGRRFEMFDTKKWMDRFDRWTIAITFAEAGQREMALNALNEKPKNKRVGLRVRKHAEQRPVLRA